jgi:hypothetical protein
MPSPASCHPCWLITFCSYSLPTSAILIQYIYVCVCVTCRRSKPPRWLVVLLSPFKQTLVWHLKEGCDHIHILLSSWFVFPLYSAVQQIIKALFDVCSFHSMPDGYSQTVIAASPFAGICLRSAGPNWVRSDTNLNATGEQPKFTFCRYLIWEWHFHQSCQNTVTVLTTCFYHNAQTCKYKV